MTEQLISKRSIRTRVLITVAVGLMLLYESFRIIPQLLNYGYDYLYYYFNYVLGFGSLGVLSFALYVTAWAALLFFAYGRDERTPLLVGYTALAVCKLFELIVQIASVEHYFHYNYVKGVPYYDGIDSSFFVEVFRELIIAVPMVVLVVLLFQARNRRAITVTCAVILGATVLGSLVERLGDLFGDLPIDNVIYFIGVIILSIAMLDYFNSFIGIKNFISSKQFGASKNREGMREELKNSKRMVFTGKITEQEYAEIKALILEKL